MLKQLLISGVLLVSAVPPALAGPTGFWGTSQVPNVACNIWGCPNAPLGAECTIRGCPPSPPAPSAPPAPSPTFILVPGNTGNTSSSNNGMGDCMDRVMYQDFRAKSGPSSRDLYTFDLPRSLTSEQIQQAGFQYSDPGFNQHKQSVVRVQVKTAEQAAPVCR